MSLSLPAALAVLLVFSPIATFAAHAICYRAMRGAGRAPTAHASAIVGIAVCFVIFLFAAAAVTWTELTASVTTALAALAYIGATYGALSVLYLDVVNIAETSLHMHVLLEIAWDDRLSMATLTDEYSPDHMIRERLDRLTGLGQVRREGDRFYLGNRSALRLARTMDIWRRVIGLPTTPEEALSGR